MRPKLLFRLSQPLGLLQACISYFSSVDCGRCVCGGSLDIAVGSQRRPAAADETRQKMPQKPTDRKFECGSAAVLSRLAAEHRQLHLLSGSCSCRTTGSLSTSLLNCLHRCFSNGPRSHIKPRSQTHLNLEKAKLHFSNTVKIMTEDHTKEGWLHPSAETPLLHHNNLMAVEYFNL